MLRRGIIAAYDSGTHTATIRFTGSTPQSIAGIRVAANIAAAAVTVNRRAVVDDGPDGHLADMVVLAVHD
jgi:hypothetical protein